MTCFYPVLEMEKVVEPTFKATLDWDPGFLELAGVSNAADSVPLSLDITWENVGPASIEGPEDVVNSAIIGKEDFDDNYYVLIANHSTAEDTTTVFFEIYGELEEKSYNFVTTDLLASIFEEGSEPPAGSIIPYLLSEKSEAAITPALITIFGAADLSGSTFEITEVDTENNVISGNFNINYAIAEGEDQPREQIMEMKEGSFTKVPIAE